MALDRDSHLRGLSEDDPRLDKYRSEANVQIDMRFISESCQEMTRSEFDATELANGSFLQAHLNWPFSRIWLAEIERDIVAVGILVLFIRPPIPGSPPGV